MSEDASNFTTKTMIGNEIRTRILLDHPFFGALGMHLHLEETTAVETLSVSPTILKYNPEYLASLSGSEQLTAFAHEFMHLALLHPFRRGSRKLATFNAAGDYAINPLLLDAGFVPITGWLCESRFRGMSAEAIYAKLVQEQGDDSSQGSGQTPGGGQGSQQSRGNDGKGDSGACPTGDFTDAPAETEEGSGMSEQDWKLVAEQASVIAQSAGTLPGGMRQEIQCTHAPKVNWKQELCDFTLGAVPSDYSWTAPNRRYISQGVYLPGTVKENMGVLAVAVDMSGSTWGMQHVFASEIQGVIKEARPEMTVVIYWDTRVIEVNEYGPDDDIKLEAKGGGGTHFQPVLDWVDKEQLEVKAMICLTDLEIGGRMTEPDYPVLFCVPEYCRREPPFGRVVAVEVER